MRRVTTPDDELIEISGWTDADVSVLYAACVLEELSLIELVERLNELNQNKMLSIGAGEASNLLHEFWDQGYKRMPPKRRAAVYAAVLGSSAAADADRNDDFSELLEAVVSALADGSPEAVAPAATALRDNLQAHTGEASSQAADELRRTLGEVGAVLSDMELRSAYGVEDMWALIEKVQQEFGGDADVQRVRSRAVAGASILRRLPELCDATALDDEPVAAAKQWLPANAA